MLRIRVSSSPLDVVEVTVVVVVDSVPAAIHTHNRNSSSRCERCPWNAQASAF